MRTFFLSFAGALTALIVSFVIFIFAMGVVIAGIAGSTETEPQAGKLLLTLDLRDTYPDQAPTSGPAALFGGAGFIDILTKLDAAKADPAVQGLFIRAADGALPSSRAEELRTAIRALQEAGKQVFVHSQGSFATGPSGLRAIAAADKIWMQPGADIMVSGVSIETLFMKDLLDTLAVSPEIEAFYEYKNSPNQFKEQGYTEPHREAVSALADSIWQASLSDIAEDRGLSLETVKAILESGPKSADQAAELGLVDALGWPEGALEEAQKETGDAALVKIDTYNPPYVRSNAPAIAIVAGEGAIVTGQGNSGFSSDPVFASDPVAEALLDAGRDEDVRAIVFRVDSPGGSPTASDQIWRAIERVQDMGKPVIVSMGSLAASGGYYVSTGADHILASRSTITGSIGIFGGKFAIAGGLQRIGINSETVSVGGDYAGAFGTDPFTDTQRTMLVAILKRGYDRFTSLVAEGRGMSIEAVHAVAKGRVWSGEDALEQGLVDEIGGITAAVAKARELANISDDTASRLVYFPQRKTGLEALENLFGASAEAARAAAILGRLAGDERLNTVISQMGALENQPTQALAAPLLER